MRIGLKIGSKLTLIQRAKGIYGLNRGSAGPCIPDQRIFQNSFFSFYQDFCVKKLKFCCPGRDEFGKKCKKCPIDADGTVCSGNGICVGAGDKEGPGNCKCNDHFAGWKCHECHEDYYMSKGECHKCHKSCKVSYTIIRSLQCVATIAVPDPGPWRNSNVLFQTCTGPKSKHCKACASHYIPRQLSNGEFECKYEQEHDKYAREQKEKEAKDEL